MNYKAILAIGENMNEYIQKDWISGLQILIRGA